MSISRAFSPEELEAMAPWRLPDIGLMPRLESRVEEEEVDTHPAITAEEIEAIQKQAYEEAAVQGRQDGYQEGKQQGYEEGKQEGFAEGCKLGEAKLEDARREQGQRYDQLFSLFDAPLAELDEQIAHELALLAVAIAKQVVRRELATDPGQIVATVKSAAAALPSASSRDITLHLHPDDAELVTSALSLADGGAQWKVLEDPLITRGGCRVTSESSMVDATVEKRLSQAIAKVLGDEREASA